MKSVFLFFALFTSLLAVVRIIQGAVVTALGRSTEQEGMTNIFATVAVPALFWATFYAFS